MLPRPADDARWVAGSIPFLLSNINRRRASFERSSQLFFLATIVFGLLFVLVTVWYGFVLLDQVPVGPARRIANINEDAEQLRDDRTEFDSAYRSAKGLALTSQQQVAWGWTPSSPLKFRVCHEATSDLVLLRKEFPVRVLLEICGSEIDRAAAQIPDLCQRSPSSGEPGHQRKAKTRRADHRGHFEYCLTT